MQENTITNALNNKKAPLYATNGGLFFAKLKNSFSKGRLNISA